MQIKNKHFGFVTILGLSNVGKSTLLNKIIGSKVSIVSPKVQTTRTVVRGIGTFESCQIVFRDTPGFFQEKKSSLDQYMLDHIWANLDDSDAVVLVVDAQRPQLDRLRPMLKQLEKLAGPVFLVLNKVDLVDKPKLLGLSQDLHDSFAFKTTYMICAESGSGIEDLRQGLCRHMPEGDFAYDEEEVSDMPNYFLTSEVVREKLFLFLGQELPYAMAVVCEKIEDGKDLKLYHCIYLSQESHKPMVLGAKGSMIKRIGEAARKDLIELYDKKVHLFLHVKVQEKWMHDPEILRKTGLAGI